MIVSIRSSDRWTKNKSVAYLLRQVDEVTSGMTANIHGLRCIKSFERSGSGVRFMVEADGVLATVELSIPAARIIRHKILPVKESPTERVDLLEPGWH